MDEGLGVFFDQFGNPIDSFFPSPVPGPDFPGGELPNPRDIPGIIIEGEIKNRATEELSKILIELVFWM
jgi:hypothetical protein